MAVVYSTDFESEAALSDVFDVQTGGIAAFATDQAYDGTRSVKFAQAGSSSAAVRTLPGDQVAVHRFHFRVHSLPGADEQILVLRQTATGTTLATLKLRSSGVLRWTMGATNADSAAISVDTWYAIDVRLTTNGATYTVDWKIDGTDQTQCLTGGNTASAIGAARWCQSGSNTFDWWIDQWQYADSSGDYPLADLSAGSTVDLSIGAVPSSAATYGVSGLDITAAPNLSDTYNRTVADGIGTADTGQSGVIDQGNTTRYDVAPGALAIQHLASDAPIWHYDTDYAHFDMHFTYSWDTDPVGSLQRVGPAWWLEGPTNYYRASITQTTSGNTNIFVEQQVANVDTTVPMDWGSGSQTATKAFATPQVAGQVYHCRVKCYDDAGTDTFLVKVWKDGDAEPSDTPAASGTNMVGVGVDIAGAFQTHGAVGARSQVLGANTNDPTYSFYSFETTNLDAGNVVGLDLGSVPSAAATGGPSLSATRVLDLAALLSPADLPGVAISNTTGIDIGALLSPAVLHGLALEVDGVHADAGSTGGTLFNFECTGENRYLTVGVAIAGSTAEVDTITFNGVPLTRLSRAVDANAAELWGLANPDLGVNAVHVTFTAATGNAIGAASFTGVDQSNPVGESGAAFGGAGTPIVSASLTAPLGGMLVCAAGCGGGIVSDDTTAWNDGGGDGQSYARGTGSAQTLTWGSGPVWSLATAVLNPVGTAPPGTVDLALGAILSPAALTGPGLGATRLLGLAHVPSAADVAGVALARTTGLGLAHVVSPGAVRGPGLAATRNLGLSHIASPAALHGPSALGLRQVLHLGHVASPAQLHGVSLASAILQSRYVVLCELYDVAIVASLDNPEQLVHLSLPNLRVIL